MASFETITEEAFDQATARARRDVSPRAVKARFDRRRNRIVIQLNTGIELAFSPKDAEGLGEASADDLIDVEVSGAGFTLHFPRIDADFSIPRLMEGFLGSKTWMQRERRATASRSNGKLGGRPRKTLAAAE